MQGFARREAAFRSALGNAGSLQELDAALDSHIAAFADRGGVYQAERSLEAVAAIRERSDGLVLAERYARRAVAHAEAHDVSDFGEQGLTAARARSRQTLAEIESALGKRDSAMLHLHQALALPLECEEPTLQRDLQISLATVLEHDRPEDAVAALFEAVALDPGTESLSSVVAVPLRRIWR